MIDGINYHAAGKSDRLEEDIGELFDSFETLKKHARLQYEERERRLDASLRKLVNILIH